MTEQQEEAITSVNAYDNTMETEQQQLGEERAVAVTHSKQSKADSVAGSQISKLKDANSKYKSLLKLAKERIQKQEEEMERLKEEMAALRSRNLSTGSLDKLSASVQNNVESTSDTEIDSEWSIIRVHQRIKLTPEDEVYALIEFETESSSELSQPTRFKKWIHFKSESALSDYVRRDSGEPIVLPAYSLTPEQSAKVEEESMRSVETVTEEFRRYRVRAEVQKKQADAQLRALQTGNVKDTQRRIEGQDFEKELAQARNEHAQLESLKRELANTEAHWKSAYETLLAENNALKSSGAEALLAAQWRQRYENCHREKEDLDTKLAMLTDKAKNADMNKYELKYRELKEAFRSYRRKAKEIFDDVQRGENLAGMHNFSDKVKEEAKIQYLRNLMVNYLSSDIEIREHMEAAIGTVLKFSDEEKARIEKKKAELSNEQTSFMDSIIKIR